MTWRRIRMSLGENLQFLRKKNNITQEQLAESLDVSRQSVSKWESDTTYPEMDKLLQLSQMFHYTIDDLMQKDVSRIYIEGKTQYDKQRNLFSKMVTLGVSLILFGVSIASFLDGIRSVNEEISGCVFLVFLIFAVAIFIVMGLQQSDFEKKYPKIDNFYSEEELDSFQKKFRVMVASGVVLILIGVIMIAATDSFISIHSNPGGLIDLESILGGIFLLIITAAVSILVYAGLQKNKYDIEDYNLIHDPESERYKRSKLVGKVCGCLMITATIIYLIIGFVFRIWGMPSIVIFAVFGLFCAMASIILQPKNENK